MIKHIVMWKLKDHANGATKQENVRYIKELLDACKSIVPGIIRYECVISQPGMEATCDLFLYAEFFSHEALKAYNEHPKHLDVKKLVAPLRDERHCFDYEIT